MVLKTKLRLRKNTKYFQNYLKIVWYTVFAQKTLSWPTWLPMCKVNFSSSSSNIWCDNPSLLYKQCLLFRWVSIFTGMIWTMYTKYFFSFLSNIWCAHPSSPYMQCLFSFSLYFSFICWPTILACIFNSDFSQQINYFYKTSNKQKLGNFTMTSRHPKLEQLNFKIILVGEEPNYYFSVSCVN